MPTDPTQPHGFVDINGTAHEHVLGYRNPQHMRGDRLGEGDRYFVEYYDPLYAEWYTAEVSRIVYSLIKQYRSSLEAYKRQALAALHLDLSVKTEPPRES